MIIQIDKSPMANQRRKCRLADTRSRDVDLRKYEQIIINTVNMTVAGKNPKVYQDYFSTDPLSQSEAVQVGRALSKLPELKGYGKSITIFRLFDGKTYESEESKTPISKSKGGRVRDVITVCVSNVKNAVYFTSII